MRWITIKPRAGSEPMAALSDPLTFRLAGPDDHATLRRLAQLDSRPLPPGPHLVAEREGRIDAALSLSSRELVADPFRPTAGLCKLLRIHAGRVEAVRDHPHSGLVAPRSRLAAT
jgi:hypothetical protein